MKSLQDIRNKAKTAAMYIGTQEIEIWKLSTEIEIWKQ